MLLLVSCLENVLVFKGFPLGHPSQLWSEFTGLWLLFPRHYPHIPVCCWSLSLAISFLVTSLLCLIQTLAIEACDHYFECSISSSLSFCSLQRCLSFHDEEHHWYLAITFGHDTLPCELQGVLPRCLASLILISHSAKQGFLGIY